MKEFYTDSILLIDDNDTDNFIHKRIIELAGFAKNVVVKNSGKSALEYLEDCKSKPETIPSVVFLDINMPIVDGFVFLFEFDNFTDEIKQNCKIVITF